MDDATLYILLSYPKTDFLNCHNQNIETTIMGMVWMTVDKSQINEIQNEILLHPLSEVTNILYPLALVTLLLVLIG